MKRLLMVIVLCAAAAGCRQADDEATEARTDGVETQQDAPTEQETQALASEAESELDLTTPTLVADASEDVAADPADIPRFAANSPFGQDTAAPAAPPKREKVLWAKSIRMQEAPEIVVEKWLTEEPELEGKYVLIEFWATWCPHCVRSIPLLNSFHEKYKDELVVIGISSEPEADVRKLKEPTIQYYSAIDTQKRMEEELGVIGIPHAILIEPEQRLVIWEGYPLQPGYELTDEMIRKTLEVGRRRAAGN